MKTQIGLMETTKAKVSNDTNLDLNTRWVPLNNSFISCEATSACSNKRWWIPKTTNFTMFTSAEFLGDHKDGKGIVKISVSEGVKQKR